jgi:hypothetical protein
MSSIPVPAPLYRRPTLRIVSRDDEPTAALVRPFTRRRRTIRSLREQILCDPQYSRQHIL